MTLLPWVNRLNIVGRFVCVIAMLEGQQHICARLPGGHVLFIRVNADLTVLRQPDMLKLLSNQVPVHVKYLAIHLPSDIWSPGT